MSKNLYEFLKTECLTNPSERKIYFGRDISAGELLNDIHSVAGFLQNKGIKKGDVVALCLPNIPQAVVSLYAVNSIGAIAYVLHPKTGVDFFAEEIKKTKVKAVFLLDRFAKKYEKTLSTVKVVVECRISDYLPFPQSLLRLTEPPIKYYSYKDTLLYKNPKEVEFDGKETAIYLNSSGTTGEPKIVMLSSDAFNSLALNVKETVMQCDKYVKVMGMLMTLPLFHGFGLGICVHLGLLVGYVVPVPVFKPSSVVRQMRKVPVNIIVGVPGMLRKLASYRAFKGDYLKNIRFIFTGGDKVSEAVKEKFERRLFESGCDTVVMEGYGLSETASVVTINTKEPNNGSLGQPIHGVKVKIFADGKECKDSEQGEIAVCSPCVMNGYLDGQESLFYTQNGEKYLATGDIGYLNGESLYFVGRKKRMIKIGGINVFPSQVEEVAVKFSGVFQACAVRTQWQGKPAIKLLIVAENHGEEYKKALVNFIGKSLIKYAEPKFVENVDKIKTTAIGKADYAYYERS